MKRTWLSLSAFFILVCPLVTHAEKDAVLSGVNASIACNEKLKGKKDVGYRGCQTRTKTGRQCQKWSSQSPQKHTRTPKKRPGKGLKGNFCRNPDGHKTIWCYTTDPKKRYEECDPKPLKKCNEKLKGKKDAGYRGCQTRTKTGRQCQKWLLQSPHKHTRSRWKRPGKGIIRNYCRNPDGHKTIWCYTTDPKKRYEECVPKGRKKKKVKKSKGRKKKKVKKSKGHKKKKVKKLKGRKKNKKKKAKRRKGGVLKTVTINTEFLPEKMSWKILKQKNRKTLCKSRKYDKWYSKFEENVMRCKLTPGVAYILQCLDRFGSGWAGGSVTIQGVTYCGESFKFRAGRKLERVFVVKGKKKGKNKRR